MDISNAADEPPDRLTGPLSRLAAAFWAERASLAESWLLAPPGIAVLWLLLWGIRAGLNAAHIGFPANVTAMLLVFGLLLLLGAVLPAGAVDRFCLGPFRPATNLLLRYMALYFSFALLDIIVSPAVGVADAFKIVAVFVVGFALFVPLNAYLGVGARALKERVLAALKRKSVGSEAVDATGEAKAADLEAGQGVPASAEQAPAENRDEEPHADLADLSRSASFLHPPTSTPLALHLTPVALPPTLSRTLGRETAVLPALKPLPVKAPHPGWPDPWGVAAWVLILLGGIGASAGTGNAVTMFMLGALNVLAYLVGMYVPDKIKIFLHPLITCTLLMWLALYLFSLVLGIPFQDSLSYYQTGHTYAVILSGDVGWPGAGDMMLSMLDAAVVALGFRCYEQRKVLAKYPFELLTALALSSLLSLFFHTALARLLWLPPALSLALAPRSVTAPIAIQVQSLLALQGGTADVPLCTALVVGTGISGAVLGPAMLRLARVPDSDPLARGLGMGATSHGIATAALLQPDPAAAAVAGVGFAGFGVAAVLWTRALGGAMVALAGAGYG
ncbi:LrgB-like family-domain-containing protein [Hyaloraphidium curvatum]|nr:LrgB-like family-domain-containing protein [Hyaloraphidium curvatum]